MHGLWYGVAAMWPLARSLQRHGCSVSRFGYASVGGDWEHNVAALLQHLEQQLEQSPDQCLHIVAHSLGGLLALAALARQDHASTSVAQLLMLGTPLQGSVSAQRLLASGLSARMLGHSGQVLEHGLADLVPVVARHCRLVMIAGNKPFGLGRLLADLHGAHDGTVAVAETEHPALHEHLRLPVSHTGLLLSPAVRDRIFSSLRHEAAKPLPSTDHARQPY